MHFLKSYFQECANLDSESCLSEEDELISSVFFVVFFSFETILLSRSIKTTEGEKSKILREMRTRRKQLVKLGIIYPIVSSFPLEKSFVVVVTVVVSVVIPPVPPSVLPIVELEDFLTNFLTFFTLVDPVSDMVLMP